MVKVKRIARRRPGHTARRPLLLSVLVCLAAAVCAAFAGGGPAGARSGRPAASGVDTVAAALRRGPVYVDPGARGQLSAGRADALARTVRKAGRPVFVAVLPATAAFPPGTVPRDLRSAVGVAGVYAIRLGDRFDAGADPGVMAPAAVTALVDRARRADGGGAPADAELTAFVDQAVRQAHGSAPDSWSGGSGNGTGSTSYGRSGPGTGLTALVVLAVLLLVGAGSGVALHHRRRARRSADARARLDRLRTVVDEDVTAFGEELDRRDFSPGDPTADDAQRADWAHALDAYELAKRRMSAARTPDDVRPATEALEDGRFALATLAARRAGRPLPERRPPCFFDPRHGPSVRDVPWTPPGGVPREVPACAADATRVEDGEPPDARTVPTAAGPQPYWNAGPAYAPWAGGYFGGGLLPGLLAGTLLGGALAGPGWGYGYGYDAGQDGYGGDFQDPDGPDGFGGDDGFGGGWG